MNIKLKDKEQTYYIADMYDNYTNEEYTLQFATRENVIEHIKECKRKAETGEMYMVRGKTPWYEVVGVRKCRDLEIVDLNDG